MSATTTPAPPRRLSPRRRAQRWRFVQYGILALAVLLAILFVDGRQVTQAFLRPDLVTKALAGGLGRALLNTIVYTAGGFVLGLFLGTVLALMKLSSVAPYRWIATAYIEFFRGLPAIIVFMAFSLIALAFPGLRIPGGIYGTVWLALAIVGAAYMAETVRAGIQAVPKGQVEAARSLGMPTGAAMRRIVLPQAFRIITPPLTNELIMMTKDSSLVYVIGLSKDAYELTKYGRDMASTFANLTPLVVAGAAYLLITVPLGMVVRRMEKKAARAR